MAMSSIKHYAAAATVFLGVAIVCRLISYYVFYDYPRSMDEYAYHYQAQIFAQGKHYLSLEPWQQHLKELYMVVYDNKLFSKYAPGWSFILSTGFIAGDPALVNPLITGLTALFLFLTIAKLTSPKAAFLTSALLMSNIYFLGYGSSYFPHTLVLCLWSIGFYCMVSYAKQPANKWLLAIGIIIGLGWLVRPLDALCLLLTMCLGLLIHHKDTNALRIYKAMFDLNFIAKCFVIAVPATVGLLALFTYNWFLSDCFCVATYKVWDLEFRIMDAKATGFMHNLELITSKYYDGFKKFFLTLLSRHYIDVMGWPFFLLALYGIFLPARQFHVYSIASIVLLVMLYNFHQTIGWPQYGARYWYLSMVPITLFVGYACNTLLKRLGDIFTNLLLLLVVLLQLNNANDHLKKYGFKTSIMLKSYENVKAICPEKSIVFLERKHLKHIGKHDLLRNPLLNGVGPRVMTITRPTAEIIKEHLPDYKLCVVEKPDQF